MSEHYDFHYQPTGSGAISGQQVLQQTEDAINELGDYVNDNVGGAMDVAQQALETAQTAETNAQTALDTANSFSSAIQSAQQDASTALSTAQTAQTTASNANNTAIQAQQDASSAVTTANNASGQVNTLSGTVTALGQRVTTAEGNIGQNTSDITALTTRVGTAEGNITTLQNDVTIAQGNASSAMATAGQVKQQAYVFRYSSTTLVASSTNSNSLLDNTDNLKVGDKVIDSSGVLFSITAIDTQNSTFTIGTVLIDLAQDSDVVHKSGNETIDGIKTFSNDIRISKASPFCNIFSSGYIKGQAPTSNIYSGVRFFDDINSGSTNNITGGFEVEYNRDGYNKSYIASRNYAGENHKFFTVGLRVPNDNIRSIDFLPSVSDIVNLGSSNNQWNNIYSKNYYYNGTAWGLDKDNSWTGSNIFHGSIILPSFGSPNYKNYGIATSSYYSRYDNYYKFLRTTATYGTDNTPDTSKPSFLTFRPYYLKTEIMDNVVACNDGTNNYLTPITNNTTDLGTSTTKWKSFNGLEPSSLSLPSGNASDVIDISSYITALDGTDNPYTAPANGWVTIAVGSCTTISCIITGYWSDNRIKTTSGNLRMMFPILKNQVVKIQIIGGTIDYARFIPCQGNV